MAACGGFVAPVVDCVGLAVDGCVVVGRRVVVVVVGRRLVVVGAGVVVFLMAVVVFFVVVVVGLVVFTVVVCFDVGFDHDGQVVLCELGVVCTLGGRHSPFSTGGVITGATGVTGSGGFVQSFETAGDITRPSARLMAFNKGYCP